MKNLWIVLNDFLLEENELRLLDLLAGILIGISPILHLIIVKGINVPYGRFASSSWGFTINVKLAWFIQELPSLVIPLYIISTINLSEMSIATIILMGLFIAHYINRVAIYSFHIRGGKDTPCSIALLATIFTTYNGYMQSAYILRHANYSNDWIYETNFIVGVFIFFWGMITNIQCDSILRNLRKPGETGYKIPHGNMFEYVSCGNLFAESVEWFGFAVACWSLQAAAFSVFAILFLSARSYNHHIWYQKKFDDYPDMKIFIPLIV